MATPDSSATSPSPPMTYLTQAPLPPINAGAAHSTSSERDDRKKAVEKFRERARLSSVTRALRARLAYASFKATHNIPHVSLRDLEDQSSNQVNATHSSRTIAAKRKAGVTTVNAAGNNHGGSSAQASGAKKAASFHGSSSQRVNYYPTINGTGSSVFPSVATTSRLYAYSPSSSTASSFGHNLYASLLAPPPAKHARTIHNPSDPPPSAPTRPVNSPRDSVRSHAPAKSIAEGTRAHTKGRTRDGKQTAPKTKRSPKGKPKRSDRRTSGGTNETNSVDGDGDVDMKAAAALTSLLLHNHRGSASLSVGAGSASSPRSSIDGAVSEAGSVASFSQYGHSSSRTFPDSAPSTQSSESTLLRPLTPVASAPGASRITTTPRPDPTDNEAADLMLFLATSPSPARQTTTKEKNARDLAAYRTLSSGKDRPKGRVLFPTAAPTGAILDDVSRNHHPVGVTKPLARGGTGESSFASSISSIGSYMGADGSPSRSTKVTSGRLTPTNQPSSQLLPPPSLPGPRNSASPPDTKLQPASQAAPLRPQNPYPPSTSSAEFNFNDFINASPSPRASKTAASPFDPSSAPKPNLSLRADVGRKLFEEEQIRLGAVRRGVGPDSIGAQLGASIDLNS